MVDGRLGIGIHVPSDDHMETFFITNTGLRRYEIVEEPFNDFLAGKDVKLAQLAPLTP